MSNITYLTPISKLIDERFWTLQRPRYYYSHHMYLHSPYETDDSCGNCDGARCDGCKLIKDPTKFECGIEVNILEDILVSIYPEVDRSIIRSLCVSDRCNYVCEGYGLVIPSEYELEDDYPEFYKQINAVDINLMNEFKRLANELKTKCNSEEFSNCWFSIEKYIKDNIDSSLYNENDKTVHNHFENQIYRLWDATGKHDTLESRIDKFVELIDELIRG